MVSVVFQWIRTPFSALIEIHVLISQMLRAQSKTVVGGQDQDRGLPTTDQNVDIIIVISRDQGRLNDRPDQDAAPTLRIHVQALTLETLVHLRLDTMDEDDDEAAATR